MFRSGIRSVFAIALIVWSGSAFAQNLGGLKTPLESLGPITSLTEEIQKGSTSDLTRLIDENDCQRNIIMPEAEPPLEAGDIRVAKFSIEITGAGCPVTYIAAITGVQKPEGFEATLNFKYRAISAEAKALYDVDQIDFAGTLKADVKQLGMGADIKIDFSYAGTGNSQSLGAFSSTSGLKSEFSISIGGAVPAGGGSSIGIPGMGGLPGMGGISMPFFNIKMEGFMEDFLTFEFRSEKAEMKSRMTMSGFIPQAEFTVNGKAVTEAQYKKVRDLVKLPGMDMEAPGLGSTEPKTLECKAEIFKSSDFSLADANRWITAGGTRPAPLKTSRSCGGMRMDMDQVDRVPYTATFAGSSSHTSIRVEFCEPGSLCEAAERLFLPDESVKYADDVMRRFTVITSCEVVPECVP